MPLQKSLLACLCLLAGIAAPCRAQDDATFGEIKGTVTYLIRMALPPDAVVTVRLEDVTPGEKYVALVGSVSLPTLGKQVPIPFRLPYPKNALIAGHQYAFRANITARTGLLFLGGTSYVLPAEGATSAPVNIPVEKFVQAASFLDTRWMLTELKGKPVASKGDDPQAAHLIFQKDGKVVGSGGVNRMTGGYTRKGSAIAFKPAAMTMMAGPPALMEQERAFAAALAAANNYRIYAQTLELRKDSQILARFTAP